MCVHQDDVDLYISNFLFIESTVNSFGFVEFKAMPTVISSCVWIDLVEERYPFEGLFSQLVGGFLYLAKTVRPDNSFLVARLELFCTKPRVSYFTAAKQVLQYLKGTW